MKNPRDILYIIKKECIDIHRQYGPGLLERTYQLILKYQLEHKGLDVKTEVPCPLKINDFIIDDAYRIDMIVEDVVIVELKTVAELKPVHHKQLATYMTLAKKEIGLLVNFYCANIYEEGLRAWDISKINSVYY